MENLSAKDVVLILLDRCPDDDLQLRGITRIQKLAYLLTLSPEFKDLTRNLEYRPLHYGPFSKAISDSVEILQDTGFIEGKPMSFELQVRNRADELAMEEMSDTKEFIETLNFRLTKIGKFIADFRFNQLTPSQQAEIERIAKQFGGLSLKELIRRVYVLAPEDLLRRSKIKDEMVCH